jgi:hypothetical protein
MQMEQQAGYKLSYDTPQKYAQTVMRSVVPHSHSEESLLPSAAFDTTATQQTLQQQLQQQTQQQQEWEVYDASRYDVSGVSTDDVAHSVADVSLHSEQQLIEEWTYIAQTKKQQQSTAVNIDTATAAATAAAAGTADNSGSYWYSVDGSVGSVHDQMRDSTNADVAPRVNPSTQMRPSQYCSVMNPYAVFTSNNSSSCDSSSGSCHSCGSSSDQTQQCKSLLC